jgi:broad specificity phosphatase PhoE
MLASEEMDLEPVIESAIAEWRRDETVDMVASRLMPFWERLCVESEQIGPVCIVTHGGPLRLLLHRLGVRKEVIESYTSRYDSHNPAPPAGTWLAQRDSATSTWHLELVFTPSGLL